MTGDAHSLRCACGAVAKACVLASHQGVHRAPRPARTHSCQWNCSLQALLHLCVYIYPLCWCCSATGFCCLFATCAGSGGNGDGSASGGTRCCGSCSCLWLLDQQLSCYTRHASSADAKHSAASTRRCLLAQSACRACAVLLQSTAIQAGTFVAAAASVHTTLRGSSTCMAVTRCRQPVHVAAAGLHSALRRW